MKIDFSGDFDFNNVERVLKAKIQGYGVTAAANIEAKAKTNAPWQDQTGFARNRLKGDFEWKKDTATITLSGGVDYQIFLELAMAKKYAIIMPTLQAEAPKVFAGYKRLI